MLLSRGYPPCRRPPVDGWDGVVDKFIGDSAMVVFGRGWMGGVVDKFIGDSAMVVFGVPEPGPRDAANALDGARAKLAGVVSWNGERGATGDDAVRIGVGVHWGRVFRGAVGDTSRLEFTMLGDTVNVAARLEEATKRAGFPLVVSDALLMAAGLDPTAEDGWVALPDTAIRGRDGDVRHYGRS